MDISGGSAITWLGILVFLATTTLAFLAMNNMHSRAAVKRRAAGIRLDTSGQSGLRSSSSAAMSRLIEYTQKHYATGDSKDAKVLKRRLMQAGVFDPRGVAFFFIARTVLAVGLAFVLFLFAPVEQGGSVHWLMIGCGGIAGYLAPSLFLDRRISQRRDQYRAGFPDFMDLLVVCADAGLSMEAALERVGREIADSYPALTANIHMTNLEIRAGKTLSDALEGLSERLGMDEARSFATLIQQSDELGSSITEALRVYSDDMRHKRLSAAEEKAYALPSKMSLPLMVCVFPVLFVVILLPVIVRVKMGAF